MRRNYSFISLAAIALLLLCNVAASAQSGELRGHVVLKQADGKKVPVAGAAIDVYRTDISGKYDTKTNKKGEFVFVGLPYIGTYTIVASTTDARPDFIPNVKAGRGQDYELVLVSPGDGKRPTIEEIRAASAASQTTGGATSTPAESAADKAKRAEVERKNAEIAAKNEKVKSSNEVVARTFKAGNEAVKAKNYDEAIKQYDEGIAADPQAAFFSNKSIALRLRGVERYNAALRLKADAGQQAALEAAKKDFRESAETAQKAVDAAKAEPAATVPADQQRQAANKLGALAAKAEAMRLVVTKADQSQADAGLAAYQEYLAAETDPARKSKAQLDAAQMLFEAGAADKAIVEFQKILATDGENIDALVGIGLAMINVGYANNDKAKLQEGVNYLQRFVDKAPDTHRFKADAKATIEELKKQQNVAPQRTGGGRRRG